MIDWPIVSLDLPAFALICLVCFSTGALFVLLYSYQHEPTRVYEESAPWFVESPGHGKASDGCPIPWKRAKEIYMRLNDGAAYTYKNFTPKRNGLSRDEFDLLGGWLCAPDQGYLKKDPADSTYSPTEEGRRYFMAMVHARTPHAYRND